MPVSEEMPPSRYGMAVPTWFILTGFFVTLTVALALYGFRNAAIICGVLAAACALAGARGIRRQGGVSAVAKEDTIETGMAPPTPYGDMGHEPNLEENGDLQEPPTESQHPRFGANP